MDHGPPPGGDLPVVTLGLDREIFAVPVEDVLEILDLRPFCRLPDAPDFLAGLIDVRGVGVPVIDLRAKLGLPPAAATPSTRIIVLDVATGAGRLTLGLIADRVIEVVSLDRGRLAPPPDIGGGWRSKVIRGVGRHEEEFVIVFDLERLFTLDHAALLAEQASRPLALADHAGR